MIFTKYIALCILLVLFGLVIGLVVVTVCLNGTAYDGMKVIRLRTFLFLAGCLLLVTVYQHRTDYIRVENIRHRTLQYGRMTVQSAQNVTTSNISNTTVQSCHWRVQFWTVFDSLIQGLHHCPETNCTMELITKQDYDVMKSCHVVILHHKGNWDLSAVMRVRSPNQIFVYWTQETPLNSHKIGDLRMFNWIATYHSRADIPIPYGHIDRNRIPESLTASKNWATGKSKLAIWVASNCGTTMWQRTQFVSSLRKFMNIDTFGNCGDSECPDNICIENIRSYKFYLSLENSYCEEYITEKTWRNALAHDSVPIVYGASRSDYEKLIPRNSFIHISDFSTMSSLAEYIKRIDQDDDLYNKFFEWRADHEIIQGQEETVFDKHKLCSISKRLKDSKGLHDKDGNDLNWFTDTCGMKSPVPIFV